MATCPNSIDSDDELCVSLLDDDVYVIGFRRVLDNRLLTGTPTVFAVGLEDGLTLPTISAVALLPENETIDGRAFRAFQAVSFRMVGGSVGSYRLTAKCAVAGGGVKAVRCSLKIDGDALPA